MDNLGKRLREIRKDMGKTQEELAQILNIPQTTWSNYEVGKANPPLKILVKLSEMGYQITGLTSGMDTDINKADIENETQNLPQKDFSLFKFSHGHVSSVVAEETDINSVVLLPVFGQPTSAGPGQSGSQLPEIDAYIPVVYEMLGGATPQNCGIVRVVGDSMTDVSLFNGDMVIFDRTQLEGDGIYVISIGDDVRVKRLEYRSVEKKIIISFENARRYPTPEVLDYEQAESLLRVYGKVICWMHRHPY